MARRALTGVLLVGGASRRFGSPKALAELDGETLAARAWRVLGEACDERLAVGKRGELALPFPILDDATDVRAPLAGLVAGLRAARHEIAVVLPVDCAWITPEALRTLGESCREAAVPPSGPLPGAWSRAALPVLEARLARGELRLWDALGDLDVATVELGADVVADADTPADLYSSPRCRRS